MPERPHVETYDMGLTDIDKLSFYDEPDLLHFMITNLDFLDAGAEKYVFRGKQGSEIGDHLVLKLDGFSTLSENFWRQLFTSMVERMGYKTVNDTLEMRRKFWHKAKAQNNERAIKDDTLERVQDQIAAANAMFRRDSGSTPPINRVLLFNDVPIGYFQKFLPGKSPKRVTNSRSKELLRIANDTNPRNLQENIPVHVSASPVQVIDIRGFRPSSWDVEKEPSLFRKLRSRLIEMFG